MYPFYLGIDLHLKRTYFVLMDRQGRVVDERRLPNGEVAAYLKKGVPRATYAVLEATRNWPFMYDLLKEQVARVELAHPKELKAISAAAVKTDKVDARTLAHLARMNYLPIAYAAPSEVRDLRLEVRHRDRLVSQRTQAKNRIHAVLASYNLVSPTVDLFGVSGREYLEEALRDPLRPAAVRTIRRDLALIDHLSQQITEVEGSLQFSAEQEQQVKLLCTMPGVGRLGAITLLAEIGDIRRFNSAKALCNWAGLTPRVKSSDSFVRRGRISKQGPALVRATMTRAATIASRYSKRWYRVHEKISLRSGRKVAKVAVARRLLTVVYYMLKRQEPYQEDPSLQDR
ncbi:MAG: IS110 family transposase [Anaerolineales bacterium]|jgi:transposase